MKLYADRHLLDPDLKKLPLLYPFWGADNLGGDYAIEQNRFDDYMNDAAQLFEVTSLEDADVAVLPFGWEEVVDYAKRHPSLSNEQVQAAKDALTLAAVQLTERAAALGKPTLVFFVHDNDKIKVPLPKAIIIRPSLNSTQRDPNEVAMPGWQADYIKTYFGGEAQLRPYNLIPTVSYCGYDNIHKRTFSDRLRHALGKHPAITRFAASAGITLIRHAGSRIRTQSLHMLQRSQRVNTNFIVRSAFWNNAITRTHVDEAKAKQSRMEYVNNMIEGDYILCARGTGNYSFRFYESLCCGRIPIFINTQCVLPFADEIDWHSMCVWIEETDIAQIANRVAEFHAQLGADRFRALQEQCRQVWLDRLSPLGFYRNLYRLVDGYIS